MNEAGFNTWWGSGDRPQDHIVVAVSDPHTVLLNLNTAEIRAYDSSERWQDSEVVAPDFALYVRALATAFFERMTSRDTDQVVDELMGTLGISSGRKYWTELAQREPPPITSGPG